MSRLGADREVEARCSIATAARASGVSFAAYVFGVHERAAVSASREAPIAAMTGGFAVRGLVAAHSHHDPVRRTVTAVG